MVKTPRRKICRDTWVGSDVSDGVQSNNKHDKKNQHSNHARYLEPLVKAVFSSENCEGKDMGECREPGEVGNSLPVIQIKTLSELGNASYDDWDACDELLVTQRHDRCLESIGPNVHIWCICPSLWRFAHGVDIGFSSAADKSKIWGCYKAAEYLNNCEYSFRSSGVIFTPIPSISGFDCNGG